MNVVPIPNEVWLNDYERDAVWDIAQSSVSSFTYPEVMALDGEGGAKARALLEAEPMNYGWIEGSPGFKRAVASRYRREVPDSQILQFNGASGANLGALTALVGAGDHVVVEWPTYQPLWEIPRALGADVSLWELRRENDWKPDLDALERLVRKDTRLICLNNAANPTAAVLSPDDLERIAEIARWSGAYVLSDEVYLPVVEDQGFVSIVDVYEKGVATNSLSKSYSVPGCRIGWTVAPDGLSDKIRSVRDYTLISAGVPNDVIATLVLEHADQVLDRNRAIAAERAATVEAWLAKQSRASWVAPNGVPVSYLSLDLPAEMDDRTFCLKILRERGVLLIPGSCFELPGGVRLGYCCPADVLDMGLTLLGEALAEL